MARPTKRITVSEEERSRLERLLKNRSLPAGQHLRIQIVLHCIEGKTLAETAVLNKVTQQTVSRWRDRYIAQGFDGLRDRPRSGRPGKYNTQQFQETVLRKLEDPPPPGYGCWTGALLAEATGYSKDAVWRLLRQHRLMRWKRTPTLLLSSLR